MLLLALSGLLLLRLDMRKCFHLLATLRDRKDDIELEECDVDLRLERVPSRPDAEDSSRAKDLPAWHP